MKHLLLSLLLVPGLAFAQQPAPPATSPSPAVNQPAPEGGGTATVEVKIDANAKVLSAKIKVSSGSKSLDDVALKAALDSKYIAGKDEKGRNVGATILADYEFTPDDEDETVSDSAQTED